MKYTREHYEAEQRITELSAEIQRMKLNMIDADENHRAAYEVAIRRAENERAELRAYTNTADDDTDTEFEKAVREGRE
jgi:hypothetical protein